jgi:hypothetical protein
VSAHVLVLVTLLAACSATPPPPPPRQLIVKQPAAPIVVVSVAPPASSSAPPAPPPPPPPVNGRTLCEQGSIVECTAACEAHNTAACIFLSGLYERGYRVPKDATRALALLKVACVYGDIGACEMYRTRSPCVRPHTSECLAVLHAGCAVENNNTHYNYQADDQSFCWSLVRSRRRQGVEPQGSDSAEEQRFAFVNLMRECEAYAGACNELATWRSTPIDVRRFALDRICHSRNPGDACGRLKDLALQ